MDQRYYPERSGRMTVIDLDDRTPLTDKEAEILVAEQHRLSVERQQVNADIRKVTQRLLLSGEAKVQAMRDGS